MGHHYVPQKYLGGFAQTDGFVWQFDKQTHKFSDTALPSKQIAQQREYYTTEVEEQLARLVESPANAVLDKLRADDFALTQEDRWHLAVYIAVMMKRVPVFRQHGLASAPGTLKKVSEEIRAQIRAAGETGLISEEMTRQRLLDVDAVEAKYEKQPPPEVMDQIRTPWPREDHVLMVFNMTWRYAVPKGSEFFITCDNPAFFFECWGLGNDESELTFPISHRLALYGSWKTLRNNADQFRADRELVHEANRRLASGASRFVYCHRPQEWIATIATKRDPYLSRINW